MKREIIKRLLTVGISVIMTIGMPMGVLAENVEESFVNDKVEENLEEVLPGEASMIDPYDLEENAEELNRMSPVNVECEDNIEAVGEASVEEDVVEESTSSNEGSDYTYVFDASMGTAVITGYTGTASDIIIPAYIVDRGMTYRVEEIEAGAFYNNDLIQKVIFEGNIKKIGLSAFANCEFLQEVIMCDSIEEMVGYYGYGYIEGGFKNCKNLEKVILSKNLKQIESCSFIGCSSLKEIEIPSSVAYVGRLAFGRCVELSRVSFSSHGNLTDIYGQAFQGCNLTEMQIPEGVTTIYQDAFSDNPIKKLSLPKTFIEFGNTTTSNDRLLNNDDIKSIIIQSDIELNNIELGENTEIYGLKKVEKYSFFPIYQTNEIEAKRETASTVKLTWKEVSPVARYKIFRSEAIDGNYEELGIVSGTEYIDSNVKADTIVYYKICVTYIDCLGETVDGFESSIARGIVTAIDINNAEIDSVKDMLYTGKKVTPDINGLCMGQRLVKNKDYILSYINNVEVGLATVKITGVNDYSGERNISFYIVQKPKISLGVGKTYTKYDATGDGKPDKISTKLYVTGSGHSRVGTMKVYINNKLCLTVKTGDFLSYELKLLRMNDRKIFWAIRESAVTSGQTKYYRLFQYKEQKLKMVADVMSEICRWDDAWYPYLEIKDVSDDSITIQWSSSSTQGNWSTVYVWTGSRMSLNSVTRRNIVSKPKMKSVKEYFNGLKIDWDYINNVYGYQVYRKTGNSSYKLVATLKGESKSYFVDKKVSKGKKYFYKVRTYRTVAGKKIYSQYSNSKSKSKNSYKGSWWNYRSPSRPGDVPSICIDVKSIRGSMVKFNYSKGTHSRISYANNITGKISGNTVKFSFKDNWGSTATGYFKIYDDHIYVKITSKKIGAGAGVSPGVIEELYEK